MDKKNRIKFRPSVNETNCKACGYCQECCPKNIFEPSDKLNAQGYRYITVAHGDNCTGCLLCLMICPDLAISIKEE